MKMSTLDVISKEKDILANRKYDGGLVGRLFNNMLHPKNPKYTFSFYVPQYLYLRSAAFCDDVGEDVEQQFEPSDLARVLYEDFLEYAKRSMDIHDIYKRLQTRGRSPAAIRPYTVDQSHPGVIFEEIRGFELIQTRLEHKAALKGEFLLRDMLEVYPDHKFTLEDILEIVYCDFVDDYRKGLIKKPIDKIAQYVV